ncbi:LPS assembly lipoprotein LptE [Notoacmeibacter sp. MSK16QG-6]|uniref:LPS assembly lipoprotein LptE n=1 Tax=Notoacmeibacter sp. MSK16QG-6 TaxID=2957982 RepID=UPI00209E2BC1|nr:LPS assembly lipoprotein LptE [Notoacmeibacter sp. MSK16QG-6]MCP1199296.1 LPS assembly lipoprotein LptE [Notoacmeibacter sp. MSK16QG-6]
MWSYDRVQSAIRIALGALGLMVLAACTAQPLYGTGGGVTTNRLPIEVSTISGRAGFMLRDELVFLINGGRSQPVAAPFRLDVDLRKRVRTSNTAPVADGEISRTFAGQVELRGTYKLTIIETGEIVATGERRAFAQYDRSTQLYALRSAEEDAEEDAARELARIIVLALNAKLKNYAPPQVLAK